MPIIRKKAGPEFEAMEFDGSHESAKLIIDWVGDNLGAIGAYWSSNNTMTFPWASEENQTYRSGDFIVKQLYSIHRLDGCELSCNYEVVA